VAVAAGRPSGAKAAPFLPTTVAGSPTTTLIPAPGRVIIDGKGFGHGVGMAQDGAFWMGKAGKTATQIMKHFYPGTSLGNAGGAVRVPLGSMNSAVVSFPGGGVVGELAVPAGGSVRVIAGSGVVSAVLVPTGAPSSVAVSERAVERAPSNGRFGAPIPEDPAVTTTIIPVQAEPVPVPAPAPPGEASTTLVPDTIPPAGAPATAPAEPAPAPGPPTLTAGVIRLTAKTGEVLGYGGKRFRGSFDFIAGSSGMRLVNELDVEWYLRGMAEVTDPSWPAAALQSQAIAARTYALRMMSKRGEVCPTQACQVYVGAQAEYPAMNDAVAKTKGKVVLYKGQLANTFYSASGGGTIADPSEVFGPGDPIPYLQAGTYPTGDPKAWRIETSLEELGRRVGYPGKVWDVVVSKVGPSGRAVEVLFSGAAGPRTLTGPRFDAVLGLRSNNFQLIVGRTEVPLQTGTIADGAALELTPTDFVESVLDFQAGLRDGETGADVSSTIADDGTVSTTVVGADPSVSSTTTVLLSEVTSVVTTTSIPASDTPASALGEDQQAAAVIDTPDGDGNGSSVWVWAMTGGAGLGSLALALRWGLRPEGGSQQAVRSGRKRRF
jgi:SpoIID/LytB domain protein